MKPVTNIRLFIAVLFLLNMFLIFGCETAKTEQEFTPLATQTQVDTTFQTPDTSYANSENWSQAQVDAYWKQKGY